MHALANESEKELYIDLRIKNKPPLTLVTRDMMRSAFLN